MVEVFKTTVEQPEQAKQLASILRDQFNKYRINFDLHDCDNILRVEAAEICVEQIIKLLSIHGHDCEVLI
ncbi:MAG: hypothetical protein H7Y31_03925 [Chitinophagaceae bacterium]|nr:hypothetical protein [Chitinophagaceae bacterium]